MEDVLHIAICEDTKPEQDRLLTMLRETETPCSCTLFQSAEELLAVYAPMKFDLLLMDIYMDGITGVEAVTRIRETDRDVSVAFLTTSEDFALAGYRLSALGYLVKPYGKSELEDLLKRAQDAKNAIPALQIRRNGQEERVRLSRLSYLESQGRQVLLHLQDGESIQIYEKLSELLPQLPEEFFFPCHKSYCVNLSQVQYIDKELSCFSMANGDNVPIRRLRMAAAKQALQTCLLNQARRAT